MITQRRLIAEPFAVMPLCRKSPVQSLLYSPCATSRATDSGYKLNRVRGVGLNPKKPTPEMITMADFHEISAPDEIYPVIHCA